MRKLLPLIAAIGLGFSAVAANASTIVLVDNFNLPATPGSQTATDNVADSTSVSTGPLNISGQNGLATSRLVTASCLSGTQGTNNNACSRTSVEEGELVLSSRAGHIGVSTVTWLLSASTPALSFPASYFFQVVGSNSSVTPSSVGFHFTTGTAGEEFTLTNQSFGEGPSALNFNLTQPEWVTYLNKGGTLTMTVSGGNGWNAAIDSFSIQVPEPTSLALVGLALVGAGVVARRRKA